MLASAGLNGCKNDFLCTLLVTTLLNAHVETAVQLSVSVHVLTLFKVVSPVGSTSAGISFLILTLIKSPTPW